MIGTTYWHRVLLLLAFLIVVAAIDKMVKGPEANRWREYLLLVGCGLAGALVGVVHDQITVSVGNLAVPDSWLGIYGIPDSAARTFKAIAGEHYGLYLGALVGMVVAVVPRCRTASSE